MTYKPKVNDYVIWERHGLKDEGWVYLFHRRQRTREGSQKRQGISRLRQE